MQYNRRMSTNSAAILKDVRNIKRYQSYTTKKDVPRNGKDVKTVGTTNIIDLANFMENKNEKINSIDVKLEMHKAEIEKNQDIINQLNHDFVHLKEQLDKQREATLTQIQKNQLWKEQADKSNNTIKLKNSKIQEYCGRIKQLEKQNLGLPILAANNAQQSKIIATLQSQIASLQQNIDSLTLTIIQKNLQARKQKQKNEQLHQQGIKGKQALVNQKLQQKDALINNLKQTIKNLTFQITHTVEQKNTSQHQLLKLQKEISRYQQENRILETSIRTLTVKCNGYKSQLQNLQVNCKGGQERVKSKEEELANLKLNLNQLKFKCNDLSLLCDKRQKDIALKENKIDKLNIKMKQLQNCIGENYKEKDKFKILQDKFSKVKNKMQSLHNAYSSISPQIQCPFGHQLKSAVTIIPCGHNYCLTCKKGYAKDCLQCNGKLKIEAVYRNELMDEIIGMVSAIRNIIEVLQ